MPPFYGDTSSDNVDPAYEELLLTQLQYQHLKKWSEGLFVSDWTGFPTLPSFDSIPPDAQCEELDRAGLYECRADHFTQASNLPGQCDYPQCGGLPIA
ncbi:hypothetical protein AJ88_15790 [Mesorhizobium amorphae CCBAU 01583]|nr:hypothetical protein AJ88_15790 [Mesorhizobium amorphae CCBAU 01583]